MKPLKIREKKKAPSHTRPAQWQGDEHAGDRGGWNCWPPWPYLELHNVTRRDGADRQTDRETRVMMIRCPQQGRAGRGVSGPIQGSVVMERQSLVLQRPRVATHLEHPPT